MDDESEPTLGRGQTWNIPSEKNCNCTLVARTPSRILEVTVFTLPSRTLTRSFGTYASSLIAPRERHRFQETINSFPTGAPTCSLNDSSPRWAWMIALKMSGNALSPHYVSSVASSMKNRVSFFISYLARFSYKLQIAELIQDNVVTDYWLGSALSSLYLSQESGDDSRKDDGAMERNASSIPSGPQLSECNQPLSISPSEASKMLEELVQREEAGLLRAGAVMWMESCYCMISSPSPSVQTGWKCSTPVGRMAGERRRSLSTERYLVWRTSLAHISLLDSDLDVNGVVYFPGREWCGVLPRTWAKESCSRSH